MGVIIINPYFQIGGVSPPSNPYSEDNIGNGASGVGNSRMTLVSSSTGTFHDINPLDPIDVQAGDTITLQFNGQMTGTATSQSWALTTIDNFAGLVSGVSATSGTAINFSTNFSINAGGQAGEMAVYELRFEVTNSGGSNHILYDLMFMLP